MRQTSVTLTPETDRQITALKQTGFGSWSEIVRIAIDRLYVQSLVLGIPVESPPPLPASYHLTRLTWPQVLKACPDLADLDPDESIELLHDLREEVEIAVAGVGRNYSLDLRVEWVDHPITIPYIGPLEVQEQVNSMQALLGALERRTAAAIYKKLGVYLDEFPPF